MNESNDSRLEEAAQPDGNQSHRTNPGMEQERAERMTGAGAHGDARAGDEGIAQPSGPLPNDFPSDGRARSGRERDAQ